MKYLLLIYYNEKTQANLSKEEADIQHEEYWIYTQGLQQAGVSLAGEWLHPTAAATTVQVKEGKKLTTHGPFAETKEQLGGYYLLDCKDLDEAIEWAAQCPGARSGSIELRPIRSLIKPA